MGRPYLDDVTGANAPLPSKRFGCRGDDLGVQGLLPSPCPPKWVVEVRWRSGDRNPGEKGASDPMFALQIAPPETPDSKVRMVIITGPPEAQFKVLILCCFSKLDTLESRGRLQLCVMFLSFPCRIQGCKAFKLASNFLRYFYFPHYFLKISRFMGKKSKGFFLALCRS